MKPRQEIFDTYWRFAALRQEVFFSRIQQTPYPWTADEIINTHKFTNAYRASDRVSQYLIKKVIYEDSDHSKQDLVFRIILFKIFNKIETWDLLEKVLGDVNLKNFSIKRYSEILSNAMNEGLAIYTSAYMSCANKAFGYEKKHDNHLALIHHMMTQDDLTTKVLSSKSLEQLYQHLLKYPLIGKFMAYQLAIDLNYSELLDFSENDFVVAGPGAERGINKCFSDTGGKDLSYIIHWMADNQEKEFERLGLKFKSLWGRPLHAIDCQNLFCEVDKYSRVAFPELKSNRKRIKAKFNANTTKIEYFYPPKWNINKQVIEYLSQYKNNESNPHIEQLSLGI